MNEAEMRAVIGLAIILPVIGTSWWVYEDAQKIGVQPGQLNGSMFEMGPGGWFAGCFLLWIVFFPAYLVKREELKRINGK